MEWDLNWVVAVARKVLGAVKWNMMQTMRWIHMVQSMAFTSFHVQEVC